MSFEFLWFFIFSIFNAEPIVARGQRAAVVGAVPALAQWADLLEQLSEAVKDIDFCRRVARGDADDVPRVVVAIAVGGKVQRVIDHAHVKGHTATAKFISNCDRVVSRFNILKDIAILKRTVVQLIFISTFTFSYNLDNVVAGKGTVQQV